VRSRWGVIDLPQPPVWRMDAPAFHKPPCSAKVEI
jgi:hypothetical protein